MPVRTRLLPILMYHEISRTPDPSYVRFTVTPDEFDRQMAWLHRKGYHTVSFDDVLAYRAGVRALPHHSVIVTFDDGCRSAVEHAVPTLERYGFTATFYLVTSAVGSATIWARHRRLAVIDWTTARQLVADGFTCGSHTVSHGYLARIPAAACRDELRHSRAILEDRLGCEILHLSYPHGSCDAEVKRLAADAGYRTACTIGPALASLSADDLLELPRVPVYGHERFRDFTLRVRTGRPLEHLLPKPVVSIAGKARRVLGRTR
jgi:peptidoglycan/xylan/chitin deacetylase (PgdA/CDA1 family)